MTKEQLKKRLLTQFPWGIISAYVEQPEDPGHYRDDSRIHYILRRLHRLENNAADAKLWADLVHYAHGYLRDSIFLIDGEWNGEKEHSYLVEGIPLELILKLGKKYGQSHVIHNGTMYSVNTTETFPFEGIDFDPKYPASKVECSDGVLGFTIQFGRAQY